MPLTEMSRLVATAAANLDDPDLEKIATDLAALAQKDVHLPVVERAVLVTSARTQELAGALSAALDRADVTVLTSEAGADRGAVMAQGRVRVLRAARLAEFIAALRPLERPDIIIDMSTRPQDKLLTVRHLAYFLRDGGAFVTCRLDIDRPPKAKPNAETAQSILDIVARARAGDTSGNPPIKAVDRELAESIAYLARTETGALIVKRGFHWLKVRDWEADAALDARYPGWGRSEVLHPAERFTSRTRIKSRGPGPFGGRPSYQVPPLRLREYLAPTASARQILRYGDFVLPDSWRHPHQRVLSNRQLVYSTAYMARYLDRTRPTARRELSGVYYYLDTELPGHYGHVTTEVISRLWAWPEAKARNPRLRPLISISRYGDTVPQFQQQIFEAYGIEPDSWEIIGPREEVVVERLLAPTPAFENPHYVSPVMREVYQRLNSGLPQLASPLESDHIFITRPRSGKRDCNQLEDVESFFADHGFTVVRPEQYSYPEQRALFAQAKVVAGFGGSGMFNVMFNPHARVIVLSGHSYDAANEALIAAVNGNPIHYFWGRSSIDMPRGRFSLKAFRSSWDFDLKSHRHALRRVMR